MCLMPWWSVSPSQVRALLVEIVMAPMLAVVVHVVEEESPMVLLEEAAVVGVLRPQLPESGLPVPLTRCCAILPA